MITLRCSDLAALDLAARIDLRCADLWQQLDATQEALSDAMTHDGFSRTDNYRSLAERERQILRELEDLVMNLEDTCPLCGQIWGGHKVYMSQNDCEWAMDASTQTYDGAESRYRAGMWTQAQWEAFSALSAHDLGYPLIFPIDSEVARLIVLVCDRIAQIGRPVRPGSEFFNRYESARKQINTEPLEG